MNRWMAMALVCSAAIANFQAAAQTTAAPVAASSPAKKALVDKLIALQNAGIDDLARTVSERPLLSLGQQAGAALQSVAPDKREAVGKSLDADFKKYLEEAAPLIRDRALKLAPSTVGVLMEEKLSEDELKQLVAWMESPVRKKYEQMWPELRNSLLQKLLAEVSPTLDPKLAALQDKVVATLRSAGAKIPSAPASAGGAKPTSSGLKPAAKAASK